MSQVREDWVVEFIREGVGDESGMQARLQVLKEVFDKEPRLALKNRDVYEFVTKHLKPYSKEYMEIVGE